MIQDGAARAGRWSPTLLLSSFLLVLGACGSPGIENCRAEGGCSTCSVGVDQPAEPEAASPEPDPALAAGPSEEGVEEAGEATPTMLEESSEGVEDAADEAVQEIEGAVEESSEPELGSDETPLSDGAPLPDEEAAPTGTAPEVELAEEDAGGSLVPVTPAAPVAIELASLQPDAQGRVWTNAESAQLEGRVLNPRAAVLRVARGEQASEELAVDAEGAFALELALAEGASTRVRLEAEGAAPLSVEFIQDATPPALSFPGAEGGSVRVREASYPLRVSASDAWLASVRVDGRPMSAGADGLSTAQLELRDGAQELLVEATDRAGNTSRARLSVELDRQAPRLQSGLPSANELQPSEALELELAFDEPPARVELAGQAFELEGELARGRLSAPAREGAWRPTLSWEDELGNRDSRRLAFQVERRFDHSHARWDAILRAHVVRDRFDYRALRANRGELDAYIAELEAVTPQELEGWSREQRYAFWINVYNAHVIKLIVDEYPVDSIRDIGSLFSPVWGKRFIRMRAFHPEGDNENLCLDDVEHEILRPTFQDARIHAAVNCASIGCPPLFGRAFVADELDSQLDVVMRFFLRDRRRNRFDRGNNTLYLSSIFDWFEEDFERDEGSVKNYVIEYAPDGDYAWVRNARIRHLDYDWSLNEP